MITFRQSGLIDAPVEKVFACVSDPKRIPEWRTDVPAISPASGATGAGTTFTEEVHFMGTKQLHMKVTDYVLNQKLVIEALHGMPLLPKQSFMFFPEGNKTRVELTVEMKTSGLFRLFGSLLKGKLEKTWEGYFQQLNRLLKG